MENLAVVRLDFQSAADIINFFGIRLFDPQGHEVNIPSSPAARALARLSPHQARRITISFPPNRSCFYFGNIEWIY